MAILRLKDIRDMSSDERKGKVNEFRTELARLKTMVEAGGSIDNPTQIHELRKTIARLLTIEAEQKRGNEKK
ncbi:50S ribosomal protein L29 [Candidatus Bathyarchaeota archaeon]|jgi:large subunit ribosomal protein L29|nr:50S ribosomal protein L29 [Candidatus Bathyarchaeota archaeon]